MNKITHVPMEPTMYRGFPLFALLMAFSIVIGDIVDFRLKQSLEQALEGSRFVSAAFLFLFVFFTVVAGDRDETATSLAHKVNVSLGIYALLVGFNFVSPSLLPFAVLSIAADYGLYSLRNSAEASGDCEAAAVWDEIKQMNMWLTVAVIAAGVLSEMSENGLAGVLDTAFPVKRARLSAYRA